MGNDPVFSVHFHCSSHLGIHLSVQNIIRVNKSREENASITSVMSDSLQTLWTVAQQALLSIGFSRQEYWRGLLCAFPGDLPNPGIKPRFVTLQEVSLLSEPSRKPHTEAGPRVKSF